MIATPLPLMLRETMSEFGMNAVDGWWAELDEPARGDVIQLWRDACFNEPAAVRVAATFVDSRETEDQATLWHNDFYEYLVNHEICFLANQRRSHVCTLHPAARTAVASGCIDAGFECPLSHEDCPMRRLLQITPGKSIRLRIAFAPSCGGNAAA